MAQLKSGSTVGGNSILTTASSVGFPSGTVMVFHQASAPTGWTKSTAQNNKALRVVSGTGGGSGGTHGLSSPPSTSHSHSGPSHTHSTPNHSHSHSLSAGAHTLSLSQTPSHNHAASVTCKQPGGAGGYYQQIPGGYKPSSCGANNNYWYSNQTINDYVVANGGGSSHSHSLSGSITSGGSGTTGSASGTTGSSGPTSFKPQYIDVIVCSKD